MKFDTVIIDSDPITYACGFSIEKIDKETDIIYVEPIKNAYYNVNNMFKKVLETTEARQHEAYLTGSGRSNFRYEVYPQYKENRVGARRPIHFKEIRNHIETKWGAKIVHGQEADDACSIAQYRLNPFGFDKNSYNSVICSIDKDFHNVPGWHYNPRKDEFTYIDETQALRNFYLQILTGDNSDSIPRVKKGWRKQSVENLLEEVEKELEMFDIIRNTLYNIRTGRDDYNDADKEIKEKIDAEITWRGRLVHLRRYENELWSIPSGERHEHNK